MQFHEKVTWLYYTRRW